MAKKKRNIMGDILLLPTGAVAIGALPDTAPGVSTIKSDVLGGMSRASRFAKPVAKLAGVRITVKLTGKIDKALRSIGKKKRR